MIVNYKEDGWEVISQRAHGLLAAAIANQWSHRVRTDRWVETLVAIAEHDDAQVELEQQHLLTPQGGPVDFSMRKMDFAHCQETLTRAYSKSTYIALLCSYHLDFLCKDDGAEDNKLKLLIKEQKKVRNQWLKVLGMHMDDLVRDYRLLEWSDALSLLLCKGMCQPEGREIEISMGPDGQMHRLSTINGGVFTVEPWPFERDKFELHCEARIVNRLTFESDKEFKKEYLRSPPYSKHWKFERKL